MSNRQLIQPYEALNRRFEAAYYNRVLNALHSYTAEVAERLRREGTVSAMQYIRSNMSNRQLGAVLQDLYTKVGLRHARMTYSRLLREERKNFGFNYEWTQFILDLLGYDNLSRLVLEVSRTHRALLLREIQISIAAGDGVDRTVDRIMNEFTGEEYQAARVVRTEVNKAANAGSAAQARTSQYQQVKEWVSAQDSRVRGTLPDQHASHVALNGQIIDEEQVWTDPRNGDQLRFPGDPKASARSVVNCRCQAVYTFKRDAQGNLIPKRRSTTVIFPSQIPRRQTVLV